MDILKELKNFINETKDEMKVEVKDLVNHYIEKYKTYKKVREALLRDVVNTKYGKKSNKFIEMMWKELNKQFPS